MLPFSVMAGLVPAIHVFQRGEIRKNVDARHIGERSDAVLRTVIAGHDRVDNWLNCKSVFPAKLEEACLPERPRCFAAGRQLRQNPDIQRRIRVWRKHGCNDTLPPGWD